MEIMKIKSIFDGIFLVVQTSDGYIHSLRPRKIRTLFHFTLKKIGNQKKNETSAKTKYDHFHLPLRYFPLTNIMKAHFDDLSVAT